MKFYSKSGENQEMSQIFVLFWRKMRIFLLLLGLIFISFAIVKNKYFYENNNVWDFAAFVVKVGWEANGGWTLSCKDYCDPFVYGYLYSHCPLASERA